MMVFSPRERLTCRHVLVALEEPPPHQSRCHGDLARPGHSAQQTLSAGLGTDLAINQVSFFWYQLTDVWVTGCLGLDFLHGLALTGQRIVAIVTSSLLGGREGGREGRRGGGRGREREGGRGEGGRWSELCTCRLLYRLIVRVIN